MKESLQHLFLLFILIVIAQFVGYDFVTFALAFTIWSEFVKFGNRERKNEKP